MTQDQGVQKAKLGKAADSKRRSQARENNGDAPRRDDKSADPSGLRQLIPKTEIANWVEPVRQAAESLRDLSSGFVVIAVRQAMKQNLGVKIILPPVFVIRQIMSEHIKEIRSLGKDEDDNELWAYEDVSESAQKLDEGRILKLISRIVRVLLGMQLHNSSTARQVYSQIDSGGLASSGGLTLSGVEALLDIIEKLQLDEVEPKEGGGRERCWWRRRGNDNGRGSNPDPDNGYTRRGRVTNIPPWQHHNATGESKAFWRVVLSFEDDFSGEELRKSLIEAGVSTKWVQRHMHSKLRKGRENGLFSENRDGEAGRFSYLGRWKNFEE